MSDTFRSDREYVEDFVSLKHQYRALIAKLEALAKNWGVPDKDYFPGADDRDDGREWGKESCAAELQQLIQETKQ